jgi:hypothetical protein
MAACANAGDMLRWLALHSDGQIRAIYPDGPTRSLEAMAKVPWPVPSSERIAVITVDDFRQLPDGRVTANVIVDNPAAYHTHDPAAPPPPSQQQAVRMLFVQDAGQWRVDGIEGDTTSAAATPSPTSATP